MGKTNVKIVRGYHDNAMKENPNKAKDTNVKIE